MNTRRIIWIWLLILVPTLVAGVVIFRLLGHERERLEQAVIQAAEGRARLTAQSLDGAVASLQAAYTHKLLSLPADSLAASLRAWADREPLVRNVFIANPKQGLLLPAPGNRTAEEEQFAQRYAALFNGRDSFRDFSRAQADEGNESWETAPSSYNAFRELTQSQAQRLYVQQTAQADVGPFAQTGPEPRSGWMPWFWESRLHWLGWVQTAPDAPYYGVEIETSALLAFLLPSLQLPPTEGLTRVLLDGNGQPVHQQGPAEITDRTPLLARVPVGPGLPHWEVAAYASGARPDSVSGPLFTLVSTLLTLIFMAALLTGGILLTQQALRDRLDAARKTTFVSNVSHEFKTPLTTLRMYAELLAEDRVKEPDKIKRSLGIMIRETERLTRLVNNVLDFSRLEQGRRTFNLDRLDAAALAQSVLDAQAPRLREAGLALETAGFDDPAPVTADRDALAQILLNLLDNAVKYAASGGRLIVKMERTGDRARLIVEDRGPGVPPAHYGRLFEPFHRVDDSLTATQPGTGLGLSISRRLLRDMGGDLRYEPAPEGGARFILELPDENQDHPDR